MALSLMGCDRETREAGPESNPAVQPSTVASSKSRPSSDPVPESEIHAAPLVDKSPVDMPEVLPPPGQRKLAAARDDVQKIFDAYGFPVLAAFQHFCAKRVMGSDGAWSTFDVFTSTLAPTELVEIYEKRLTKRGLVSSDETTGWELPAGAPVPRRSLTVSKPSLPGRHTSCEGVPPSGTKSMITLLRNE